MILWELSTKSDHMEISQKPIHSSNKTEVIHNHSLNHCCYQNIIPEPNITSKTQITKMINRDSREVSSFTHVLPAYRTHPTQLLTCLRTHCAQLLTCLRMHCAQLLTCLRTHCVHWTACGPPHLQPFCACVLAHLKRFVPAYVRTFLSLYLRTFGHR